MLSTPGPRERARGRAVSMRVLLQMATVGACTGLVKVAGAGKVVFTARAFGMSDGLDAYLIAFLLPSFVCDTLAGSINSALVPTFIEVQERQGREAAHRLYQSVLASGVVLLSAVAVALGVLAPWALRPLATSFDAPKLALTASLFRVMAPILPLTAFTITWRSMLNVEGRFAFPAITPAFTPIASIYLLLRFGHSWGVYSLAVGTLAGAAMETAALGLCMLRRGYPVMPRWHGRSAELNQVLAQYGPIVAGMLLLGGAPLIDQAIAGMLASGSVAALNYGTRISAVLIAVGPTRGGDRDPSALLEAHASRGLERVRRSLRDYAAIILAVTIPAVALFIAYSEPLVRLLFERGQFTGAATSVVTTVQRYSLLQIPPAMVMALALRLISSMKANRLLLRAAAFTAVLNLALDLLLTRWMGIAGITLSTSIVQFAALIYLFHLMRTRLPASLNPVPSRAAVS